MKKCKKCNTTYNTDRFTCPFCKSLLEDSTTSEMNTVYQPYPKFKDKIYKINLLQRIFFFISIIAILIVIIANYYEYKKGTKSLWSIISLAAIFTLWMFVKGLIISKKNIAKRIFNFSFSVIILILTIEYCSITEKGIYTNWSINYVIPLILIGTLTIINLLSLIKKKNYSLYVGYQFWISILLILYHLLYILKITTIVWPSLTGFIYGISSLTGLFFFAGKATKEELKKRFII